MSNYNQPPGDKLRGPVSLNTSLAFSLFQVLDLYITVSKEKEICWPDVDERMHHNPSHDPILKNYGSFLTLQQGKKLIFYPSSSGTPSEGNAFWEHTLLFRLYSIVP